MFGFMCLLARSRNPILSILCTLQPSAYYYYGHARWPSNRCMLIRSKEVVENHLGNIMKEFHPSNRQRIIIIVMRIDRRSYNSDLEHISNYSMLSKLRDVLTL